jgi:thioredoxin-like negative regulator of GroEL
MVSMLAGQYFSAEWCQPCKTFRPIAYKVFEEFNIDLYSFDVDDVPEVAEDNTIMSVPTIIIYRGSKEVDRIVGAFPEAKLRERLQSLNG